MHELSPSHASDALSLSHLSHQNLLIQHHQGVHLALPYHPHRPHHSPTLINTVVSVAYQVTTELMIGAPRLRYESTLADDSSVALCWFQRSHSIAAAHHHLLYHPLHPVPKLDDYL